jgi:uncharacterized protein (TIGR03067 family)
MLAKRLTRRGVVISGGSVPAALSAGSASASAPPALVASTIQAVSLLAAGKTAATGIISAKVAALTEGMVQAMFITKIKSVLAVVLVALALTGAAGLIYQTQAAEEPMAQGEQPVGKKDQKPSKEKQVSANPPAQPKQQPARTDLERIVGNWFITNDDSPRKGEMWVFTEDSILMNAKNTTPITRRYAHRLDASKDAKEIDITVTLLNGSLFGPPVGVIRGIYALDGDELRLCLADMDKKRPAAFPEKPGPGELLILHRAPRPKAGDAAPKANPPAQPKQQPAETDLERMIGGWTIVNDDSGRKGELWAIGKHEIVKNPHYTGLITQLYFHRLDAAKSPKQIDITVTTVSGVIGADMPIAANNRIIGVIKGIYELKPGELRLCLAEMGKARPAAFPEKPKPGEVLILHGGPEPKVDNAALKKEKLRVLIDNVLAAHGGEDKLNKLQFTMTVKHSNLQTQHYFVQPPKNFRWETTHPDWTSKRIVILFPEGRRWWTKEPNGEAVGFHPTGAEPTMEYWLDYVKFFGPRQVLRLKDAAAYQVTLLDEEIKIGDRAAVGVEIKGNRKLYFDKETHLLLKQEGGTYYSPIYFSDYKKSDGIPIAQQEKDGYFNGVVTDFRVVEKFDAKVFEQP